MEYITYPRIPRCLADGLSEPDSLARRLGFLRFRNRFRNWSGLLVGADYKRRHGRTSGRQAEACPNSSLKVHWHRAVIKPNDFKATLFAIFSLLLIVSTPGVVHCQRLFGEKFAP